MLASQMVVTHRLAMDMLGRVRRADLLVQAEALGALATKLLRTYTMQMEVLAKLKRGGEQTVRVEHVHVYSGGQAVVGAVSNQPPPEGSEAADERGNLADGAPTARSPCLCARPPRCLARTRGGTPCQKAAATGKKRCRMHGGAKGSGAPPGERNGSYRHGLFTLGAIAERHALRAFIRDFCGACNARTWREGSSDLEAQGMFKKLRPRPPGPRLNDAARLPQPKSVFPKPTGGLATSRMRSTRMSTYYGLRKSIKADELFDGRLEALRGTMRQKRPILERSRGWRWRSLRG